MKFAACSDLHLTNKRPDKRMDDYFQSALGKFIQILDIAGQTDSGILVVGGDFFESAKEEYEVVWEIVRLIIGSGITILVVPGQHDLRYHKAGLKNTPLGILQATGCVIVLSNEKKIQAEGVSFIGAGWNEKPKKKADVLVTHQMVVHKEKLWHDQEDYIKSTQILKKYKWANCIISGDNHTPFVSTFKGRVNINCGSMMRSTVAQLSHKPICWIVDSNNWSRPKGRVLTVEPVESVFDFEKIQREDMMADAKAAAEEKLEKEMDAFVDSLPKTEAEKPNFKRILKGLTKQTKPNKRVKNIITKTMEKVG